MMVNPVRLCCGQRHYGAICPDGLVQCCLCFSRFPIDELHVGADGIPEDVCESCAQQEQAACGIRQTCSPPPQPPS